MNTEATWKENTMTPKEIPDDKQKPLNGKTKQNTLTLTFHCLPQIVSLSRTSTVSRDEATTPLKGQTTRYRALAWGGEAGRRGMLALGCTVSGFRVHQL